MSVRTGMYHFEVSRTAMYRVRYVLVRTSTYRHVLPCTRCTGFQMIILHILHIVVHTAAYYLTYSAYCAYCNMQNIMMQNLDSALFFCILFCIFCILFCILVLQHIIWHILHIAICRICRIWTAWVHYFSAYYFAAAWHIVYIILHISWYRSICKIICKLQNQYVE